MNVTTVRNYIAIPQFFLPIVFHSAVMYHPLTIKLFIESLARYIIPTLSSRSKFMHSIPYETTSQFQRSRQSDLVSIVRK